MQDKLGDKYFDEYYLRDMSEKLCLMFISQLVNRYDAEKLIKASFIEKWLARQNWGDSPEEIIKNFSQYMNRRWSNRVTEIVNRIMDCRSGKRRLMAAGLISNASKEALGDAEPEGRFSFMLSTNLISNDETDEQGDRLVGGRPQEQTAEEQRLRHRHREAMVFNDGSRPLNSGDIIQRDHGTTP
jgi:hypothetical protein